MAHIISSSLGISGSVTAHEFIGSGSQLVDIQTASYAFTASYALNAGGGTLLELSDTLYTTSSLLDGQVLISSLSYAGGVTSSFWKASSTVQSSSVAISASYALSSSYAVSSSHSVTASYAVSSSYAKFADNVSPTLLSTSAPQNQRSGSFWWNETDGNLYVQTVSPTGSVWVPAVATTSGGTNGGVTLRNSYSGSQWNITHNLGTETPIVQIFSGSHIMLPADITITGPDTLIVDFAEVITGSAVISTGIGGVTSASYALTALTSSHALTASLLLGSVQSASYAATASYASYALTASYAISASHEITFERSSSYAQTASYSSYAVTASYALNGGGSGGGATVVISGSVPTASVPSGSLWWNETDGNLYIQASQPTGSTYVPAVGTVTATISSSYATSASHATVADSSTSASYAETSKPLDYLYSTTTTDQTAAGQGDAVTFWDAGYNQGEIVHNTGTGQFTLKAGKKYELSAQIYAIGFSNSTGGYLYYRFEQVSGTGTLYSKTGVSLPVAYTTTAAATAPTATALVIPTTDYVVRMIISLANGTANLQASRSGLTIKEIR